MSTYMDYMKRFAVLTPLMAGACWGASGIFVRTLSGAGFDNITVMFSRSIVGTSLLFLFLLFYDKNLLKIKLRDLPIFLSLSINGYLLMNACYNIAVGNLTLSLASILLGLCPIFVLFFAAILFHEKITPVKLGCMLAALTGCMLIAGIFEKDSEIAWSVFGIAMGLGSAFFNAIYTLNSKQLTDRHYHALTINLYAFGLSALVLAPFADWSTMTSYVTDNPARGIAVYLAQALITSIAPNYLYTVGIKHIDSGKASILSCGAEPTSAMILGIIIYSEIPTPLGLLGMVITIGALYFLTKSEQPTLDSQS